MLKYDVKLDGNNNNIILKRCLFRKRWDCHGALYLKKMELLTIFLKLLYVYKRLSQPPTRVTKKGWEV